MGLSLTHIGTQCGPWETSFLGAFVVAIDKVCSFEIGASLIVAPRQRDGDGLTGVFALG